MRFENMAVEQQGGVSEDIIVGYFYKLLYLLSTE
jgi:hypothetical protein